MTWTTPKTWTVGEVVTAAAMNTHVRDNMAMTGGSDKPQCRVYCSTWRHPTAASGQIRAVNYNNEAWDRAAMHVTGSSGWKVTVPTGGDGVYLVGATFQHTASTAGIRRNAIYAGGTSSGGSAVFIAGSREDANFGTVNDSIATLGANTAGGYWWCSNYQNTGGNYDITNWSLWAIWQSV